MASRSAADRLTSRDALPSTIPRTYNHCYLSFQSEELK